MKVNLLPAKKLFKALYSDVNHGYIEIRLMKPGKVIQLWSPLSIKHYPWAKIKRLNEDHFYHAYFGVCPRKRKRGRNKDVLCATCFWVDVDSYRPTKRDLNCTNLGKPNFLYSSGNGKHGYWLLDKPEDLTKEVDRGIFTEQLKYLAHRCKADMAVTDPCRVLRLPGTINWKGKK